MNYRIKNRWVVLFGALLAQLAIGAMYAWSLFNKPISEAWGLLVDGGPSPQVVMTYAISLVCFSLASIASGRLQLHKGPRFTALIGALLYTSGILLSSRVSSPGMLYITYGVLAGSGVGFIYVCPLSTLVKWFPRHKGGITGLATAAFAGGAIIFKEVIGRLLQTDSYTPEVISATFLTLGITYGIMTFLGASLLDTPDNWEKEIKVSSTGGKEYDTREMLRSPNYYKLLFSDLLALMPGLLIIGMAKDIGRDYIGLDYAQAAGVVSIIASFNAFGRLASGRLADKLGALNIYRTMYLFTIIALAVLSFAPLNYAGFLVAVVVIGIGYGSFLSLVPTITGQLFGQKKFSSNYSFVFQAYGAAAMLGILIKSKVTYNQAFSIAMITAIAGLIIASTIKQNKATTEEVKPLTPKSE
ncbi:MAG: OFA family MFS transporter [Spirochaetaceae bacterium]